MSTPTDVDAVATAPGGPAGPSWAASTRPTLLTSVGDRPRWARWLPTDRPRWTTLATVLALVTFNLIVLTDVSIPVVRPVLALWLLFLAPTRLIATKVRWAVHGSERLVLSFALSLLGVIVGGLLLNTVLPWIGVSRPLDPVPTLLRADAVLLVLWRWRRGEGLTTGGPGLRLGRAGLHLPWSPAEVAVVASSGLGVLLAIAGAVRLNNGAGGGVAVTALVVVAGVFAATLAGRHRIGERALHLTIYLLSLTLLLMTSLRGWYTTGHDIQREYQVLELTASAGHWNVNIFQDAYNACLSITVLPTMITGLAGTSLVLAFKVYTQLIFALTPLVVYLIARRSTTVGISLIGVIFFVAFPTFADMPFLNRQEVAFLFLAAAILAICQTEMSVAGRRWLFAALTTGTVLSHYSTTYILVGVVVIAGLLRALVLARHRWLPGLGSWPARLPGGRAEDPGPGRRPSKPVRLVVGPLNIAVLVVTAFLWSNSITHTDRQIGLTARQTVQEILAPGSTEARSSDVTYNIFSGQRFDPAERMAEFRAETLEDTAAERARGWYPPLSLLDRYPVELTRTPPMPLTPVGRALEAVHVDVGQLNTLVRGGAARVLQVFVFVGLVGAAVASAFGFGFVRRRIRPPSEIVLLGTASFAVVVSQVLLPAVSVNYGVLRAFQQALIVLAPFLAVGAVLCLRWLRSWTERGAAAVAMAFLVSLTGLLPQITGGYPAQLHLNNAGAVYDVYYAHEQELAAADWLTARVPVNLGEVQYEIESHRFASYPLTALNAAGPEVDIFPTLLRTDNVVLLNYTTVTQGRAVISVLGDQLGYTYPVELLRQTRSQLYDNGGAELYR